MELNPSLAKAKVKVRLQSMEGCMSMDDELVTDVNRLSLQRTDSEGDQSRLTQDKQRSGSKTHSELCNEVKSLADGKQLTPFQVYILLKIWILLLNDPDSFLSCLLGTLTVAKIADCKQLRGHGRGHFDRPTLVQV